VCSLAANFPHMQSLQSFLNQTQVPAGVLLAGIAIALFVCYRIYRMVARVSTVIKVLCVLGSAGAFGGLSNCSHSSSSGNTSQAHSVAAAPAADY